MNDWVSLGLGSVAGALVSEGLKVVIEEAKKVLAFDKVSEELASLLESILPIIIQIESAQDAGELENLRKTIIRGVLVVRECAGVKRWHLYKKAKYTRKIEEINKDMVKFCQVELQLLMLRNQLLMLRKSAIPIEEIENNLQIVDNKFDDLLSVPPTVFTDLCTVDKLDKLIVGLDLPLMDLKKKLLDTSVDRLVVSALGGCGKTTLVTQLCHDPQIKDEFKNILFNVVSRDPDFRVLVQNLLKQKNGTTPPTFDNDNQAKVALRNLMEKLTKDGPILLVLDDVWRGAESLLDNFRIDIPGYKILVTSRFAFPSFGFTYNLAPLEEEEARALLVHWASRPDHTSPNEYEELLKKILKCCSGYPLVIEVVGAFLKQRPLSSWKGEVESWSRRETILDKHSNVLNCLQPSFDALNSFLQERFMDLGSFREDQKIRASVIIDISVELYASGSTMYMLDLDDLASQNLLKLIPLGGIEPEDGFYNDLLVTQHDILRDLSIHQSKSNEERNQKRLNLEIQGDKYPHWLLNLTEPISARLLSISTDDLFSSEWVGMDCPDVEALLLNLSSSNYALPKCIATMKKLKVIVIISHGPKPATLANLSCLTPLLNLRRIRLEKVSVVLSDVLQLQLHSLEKLSLVMCSFGEVFYDEIDVSEALPSIQEIDIDYCYDLVELPFWISEAVSLKTLSITNCNKLTKLPEAIGNLSELQVLRLNSCIDLSGLPETIERLCSLQFLDISDCLGLRKLPLEIGNLQKLKKISMRKCWRCELPDSVTKLENLVVKCDEETRMILWERLKPTMRNLEVHQVETEHNLNMFNLF